MRSALLLSRLRQIFLFELDFMRVVGVFLKELQFHLGEEGKMVGMLIHITEVLLKQPIRLGIRILAELQETIAVGVIGVEIETNRGIHVHPAHFNKIYNQNARTLI